MRNGVPQKMFQQLQKHSTPTESKKKKKWICHYYNKASHIKPCCFKYLADQGLKKLKKQVPIRNEWRVK